MSKFNVLVTIVRKAGQAQRWVRVDADSMHMASKLAQNVVKAAPGVLQAAATIVRVIK